ncbi:MAG: Fic family protein [Lacibacter sp.]
MNLSPILQQIDVLKKEADALQPVKPEYEQKFWTKYRLEFNYNSNHIEGNTLTYGHTELLLVFGKLGSDSYSFRELEEMKAHDVALKLIREAALDPEFFLSEKFIKEINQIILVEPYYKEAETYSGQNVRKLITPGQYKNQPNHVRLQNGEIFHYASAEETPALMGDMIQWIREEDEKKELHPVQLAALAHYRFVRIHPFDDSNGRTSRLLLNYILMKNGYAPLVVKSADKKNYLNALNRADTGDVTAFIDYISQLALRWQDIYNLAAKGADIEEEDDIYKEINLLKQAIDYSDDSEKTFSNVTLEKTYLTSLLPFLKNVFEEISLLDNHFLRKEIRWSGEGSGTINNVEDQFTKYVKHISQKSNNLKPFTWNFIYLHINLSKTSNINFQYLTKFDIVFTRTHYEIKSDQVKDFTIKKLFHQKITPQETKSFIKLLLKNEVEAIKKELGTL